MTYAAPAHGYAIWQAESFSRFNFCWDTHPLRQLNGTSAASRDSAHAVNDNLGLEDT
jgi:hypothetical protein